MIDADELEIFRDAVGRAVASHTGSDLDAALGVLGWSDALALDERAAVGTLFEAQGAACATSGALSTVIAHALGIPLEGSAVVLPGPPDSAPPVTGDLLSGVVLAASDRWDRALVVAEHDGSTSAAVVPRTDLDVQPRDGIGPAAAMSIVQFQAGATAHTWDPAAGTWADAVAAARRALAHEQVGAMRTMLALARDHALTRIQFGQPISGFQAVRHHLAEALVAIEAAESALEGAWIDGSPFASSVAKAVAGTSAQVVRRKAQQVLAGIGFTTEHDLHRFVRRSLLLDALFGDAITLTDEIGAELIRAGRLPRPIPL